MWLRDFEKYSNLTEENSLESQFQFERLKEIAKLMYLSPIDYEDIFFNLKEKLDTAEMIKLNLQKVYSEYDMQLKSKMQEN